MHELEVVVLDEPHVVATLDELRSLIATRIGDGNHFQVAPAGDPYPMLDVMVSGPYAVVHHFPVEGEAGAQASATLPDPPHEVDFPHTALGETITMPGSVVIDAATAIACIEQFADTLSRPTLVDWIEM